jgi:tetratricopeptide (TPR) repeat protein
MEKGGTAQPTDLVGPTRLPLNAINTQLKRLKDAQIVEVLGGGKGRAANYTVPDKLFSIWYQMRYLSQNRRRIELFVEVLRIWFAEEERVQTLRRLSEQAKSDTPHVLRECATTAEYFAASLKGTIHERLATDLCIDSWVKADLREAAFAYADLSQSNAFAKIPDDAMAHADLAVWLGKHGNLEKAVESLDHILAGAQPFKISHLESLMWRGLFREIIGDNARAIADFETVITFKDSPSAYVALALTYRSMLKSKFGDKQGAIEDLTEAIAFDALSKRSTAAALARRGWLKVSLGDLQGGIVDCDSAIAMEDVPAAEMAQALGIRAFAKLQLGDVKGGLADGERVIHLDGAPKEAVAKILFLRATNSLRGGNTSEAIADFVKILDLGVADAEIIAGSGSAAFGLISLQHDKHQADRVFTQFVSVLNSLSGEVGREVVIRFLNNLARCVEKNEWPKAARNLAAQLKPEVAEAVKFLEPVCSVLEGQDRTLLDALPPEQREFALEVLTKFEPKPEPEPAKEQKISYRKRARSKK